MTNQIEIKIESILLSAIEKLYNKEAAAGLDYEDFRIIDIIYKINKEAKAEAPTSIKAAGTAITPENLVEMLKLVRSGPVGNSE